MLSLMLSLSWKLTLLMLMETPITGLLQNIYDTFYQVLIKDRHLTFENNLLIVVLTTIGGQGKNKAGSTCIFKKERQYYID